MSLPSLHALLDTAIPLVVCARPWAKDLLAGYKLQGFVEMTGHWRQDRAAVQQYKKKAQHAHPRGLLLPDSLSSAMVFKLAGIPSAGYRDDRSEEHTSELQSIMRISYAVFCLKK